MPGLQGDMHGGEPHRLQASQQVFQDMGNSAINPQLTEAVLADSLYRSVTERLQSGAGPANFNQVCTFPLHLCSKNSISHAPHASCMVLLVLHGHDANLCSSPLLRCVSYSVSRF